MATSSAEEDTQKCPVCFELFVKPRKLPACSHVFCENCILNYLSKQKTEIESESGFQCPVCRVVNPYNPNNQDLLEWIWALDSGCVDSSDEKTMDMRQNVDLCFLCKDSEKSNAAVNYCFDCQEGFCEACCKLFHSVRAVQDHNFIKLKKEENDKTEVDLTQMMAEYLACPEHPDKTVSWICEDESKLCCPTCAFVNHRTCKQVTELRNLSSSEDNDMKCRKLSECIQALTAYGEAVIEILRKSEAENEPEIEPITSRISDMRTKVNTLFDALEKNIAQDCRARIKKQPMIVESDVQKVQKFIDKLLRFSWLLGKLNQKCLGLKTGNFVEVLLRRLQEDFTKYERTLLETVHDFKQHGFDLKVGSLLSKFANLSINKTEELATIQETESELSIPKYSGKQLLRLKDISKTGTNYIENIPGHRPLCASVLILPGNHQSAHLLLVDEENGLCCIAKKKDVEKKHVFVLSYNWYEVKETYNFMTYNNIQMYETGKPYSAAYVKDGIVAVSVPAQKKLCFLAVNQSLKVIGVLHTTYAPKALYGLKNGDIAVSWNGPVAFGILSAGSYCQEMKVYFDRDKSGRYLKTFDHMAIDEKRSHVIQPCTTDKAVYCFDFSGNPKFKYKHPELQQPSTVGIDGDGNIYVCNLMRKSAVHIISDTGLPVRVFSDGCIERPMALSFYENGTSFIIIHRSTGNDRVCQFSLV